MLISCISVSLQMTCQYARVMQSLKVKFTYLSVLLWLCLWFDGCESVIDSSLPEIFYPFGTDQGDSVVDVDSNTFAGAIKIPYWIFNQRKVYVSAIMHMHVQNWVWFEYVSN